MFLGCSPCCGTCPDRIEFPNATGFFVDVQVRFTSSAFITLYNTTFPAFDSGVVSARIFPFDSVSLGVNASPSEFISSVEYFLRNSRSSFNASWGNLVELRLNAVRVDPIIFPQLASPPQISYTAVPCYAFGGNAEPVNTKKNSLFVQLSGTPPEKLTLDTFSVHGGEVVVSIDGSTNLRPLANEFGVYTLYLVGGRTTQSDLPGFPGSFPWTWVRHWEDVPGRYCTLELVIVNAGATDDGTGSGQGFNAELVHFEDTGGFIDPRL